MKTSQKIPDTPVERRLTVGELLIVILAGSIGLNCLLIALIVYLLSQLAQH